MTNTLYRPELLYSNGRFVANGGVLVSEDGQFLEPSEKVGYLIDPNR